MELRRLQLLSPGVPPDRAALQHPGEQGTHGRDDARDPLLATLPVAPMILYEQCGHTYLSLEVLAARTAPPGHPEQVGRDLGRGGWPVPRFETFNAPDLGCERAEQLVDVESL